MLLSKPNRSFNLIGLTGDESKPGVRARGVWRPGQNSLFDIRVTNTNSDSQVHLSPEKVLHRHEQEKSANTIIASLTSNTIPSLHWYFL